MVQDCCSGRYLFAHAETVRFVLRYFPRSLSVFQRAVVNAQLRHWTDADVPKFADMNSDPAVMEFENLNVEPGHVLRRHVLFAKSKAP